MSREQSSSAESLARIADTVERLAARAEGLPPYVQPGRDVDALGRQQPRNPFRGKQGVVWFLRLPGAAEQFRVVVPGEYRLGPWVLCVCGELQALEVGEIVECAGGCGRWFLRTEESVRAARWTDTEGTP